MAKDLGSFLEVLERDNQVLRIKKAVDPKKEMSALTWQILPEKVAIFENLAGFPGWRACAGVIETRHRIALALGLPAQQLLSEYSRVLERPAIKCETVSDGPVKEVIWKGDRVDLTSLPILVSCDLDAGPYLTFSEAVTRNPDTGTYNAAVLRIQIKGKNKTGIYMTRGRHTWENYKRYEERNEPMPVAIVIGHHPALHIMGTWCGPYEADELELAGTLMREPLRLVQCETIDLKVPADAEVIIEGEVPPKVLEVEGPFAEFTGYYPEVRQEPVVNVKAITMRKEPIYEFSWSGRYEEHVALGLEHYLYKRIGEVEGHIDIKDVRVYPRICGYFVAVQFAPHYEGQAKNVLLAALSGNSLLPKIAVAVDEDVDINNPVDILWAVATRVNPKSDVFIIEGTRNCPFDKTAPLVPDSPFVQRVGSKMGIDATKPPTSKPKARGAFDRARPMGWGKVRLEDFL